MAGADKNWIAIQQSTFTNWCNDRLKGSGAKIEDLVTDLDDGVKLVILLERLAKKKVSNKCVGGGQRRGAGMLAGEGGACSLLSCTRGACLKHLCCFLFPALQDPLQASPPSARVGEPGHGL